MHQTTKTNIEYKARSVLSGIVPAALILAAGLLVVFCLLYVVSNSIDNTMRTDQQQWVESAMNAEAQRLNDYTVEYSYWTEAYQNLIQEPNAKWIEDEITSYLMAVKGVDLFAAFDSDKRLTATSVRSETPNPHIAELFGGELYDAWKNNYSVDSLDKAQDFFTEFQNHVYLVSVNEFLTNDIDEKSDGSFLLLGQRIEKDYLKGLESTYRIPGLRIAGGTISEDLLSFSIIDADQNSGYRLTWDDPAGSSRGHLQPTIFVLAVLLMTSMLALGSVLKDLSRRNGLNEVLVKEVMTDPLTKIANRRSFFSRGEKEVNHANRQNLPLSLIMLDLDHFKSINDDFGHAGGDAVIRMVGDVLRNSLRDYELPARIGGEEFAVLLPGSDSGQAQLIAERIRKQIQRHQDNVKTVPRTVTASLGVAQLRSDEKLLGLLSRADIALYEAKARGRDRCLVYDKLIVKPSAIDAA